MKSLLLMGSSFARTACHWISAAAQGRLASWNSRWCFWPLLLLLLHINAGCSPGYVLRVGVEEGKILWRRQAISSFLSRPDLPAEERQKLSLVLEARAFARDRLDLKVGGSFTTVSYLTPGTRIYVLSAAPVNSLTPHTWWFPIVGRVPYKGFFDRHQAEEAKVLLEKKQFDTYLRTAAGFSTLGWFNDPILLSALRQDEVSLVNMVIHELCHNTFSLSTDTAFDESLANFIGSVGAIEFFVNRDGKQSALARKAEMAWEEEVAMGTFLRRLRAELEDLYASGATHDETVEARKHIFFRARIKSGELKLSHRIPSLGDGLNNAVIIHHSLYLTGMETFARLYQSFGADLRATIESIRRAVKDSSEPLAAIARLCYQLPAIAPPPRVSTVLRLEDVLDLLLSTACARLSVRASYSHGLVVPRPLDLVTKPGLAMIRLRRYRAEDHG